MSSDDLFESKSPPQQEPNVRNTGDIRRHYVASLKHANTTTFVENLEVANNAMLDRLKQIGKVDSDAVTLIELSTELGYPTLILICPFFQNS